jgi:tetratricopeptide (TPR) repeat protein
MRKVLAGLLLIAGVATGLAAQAQGQAANVRVAQAQPNTWAMPSCGLDKGNFLVSSGATYLSTGVQQSDPTKRAHQFSEAERVLLDAINKGQAGASGAWYLLGRAYLYQGNLVGADTALARAQQMTPSCTKDIQTTRRITWIPLVNAGVQFMKDKNTDSAVVLLHQANLIYQGEPNGFTNLGVLYNTIDQPDSAIVYFQKAVNAAGTDAKGTDARDQAQYNLAALLSNQGRWPEAVVAWQQYLKWKPDDADGKKAYARALRASGQPDAAAEIERGLIAGGTGEVSTDDLMTAGVNFFRDKNYAEAAETFGRVVQREPWNRDALFNMANSYLGAGNGPELVKAASALNAIDPMNESSLKLLAQGYQLQKNQDMTIKLYTALEALPFSVTVDVLNLQSGGAKISGKAVGREARAIDTQPIAPHQVTLVFEFINKDMAVVASSERVIPKLNPGEASAFEAEGLGAGIVGWRYHAK